MPQVKRALVIGGSMSGLLAAPALTRRGIAADVFERVASTSARFATHGVFATQSWITLAFASARAIMPFKPPACFAHDSVSR